MNKVRFPRWPASTQKTNVWSSPHAWCKSFGEVEWLGLFVQSNTANVQWRETWVSNVNARFCGTCSTTVSAAVEIPCYHKYYGSSTCDRMVFPRYCIRTEFWRSCTSVPWVLLVPLHYWNTAHVLTPRQPVTFDTGASLVITPDKTDFDGPLTLPKGDLRLGAWRMD
jgi:hypothetical protein